ncbi:unnamed protein product [Chondrus crispus]|uniref:USP domain-containing protein n=1 Tax=Chondrus crispus TaxID=2769 RepID=R7QUQ2_CHOCR|nr:unnamed protein product [Chondrus crispus]CDF41211.1 unnamed protein product [Chondrus crispus]|eukprot:XP_005711505.1 unnamed protein product [Chondrus crispus]
MPGVPKDHMTASTIFDDDPASFGAPTSQPQNETRFSFDSEFTARVRTVLVAGNPGKEFDHVLTLHQAMTGAILSVKRLRKGNTASDTRRKSSSSRALYPVASCVKITPWDEVARTGTVAIHFDKPDNVDVESHEVRQARQAGKLGRSRQSTRTARTKVTMISVRGWSLESVAAVRQTWDALSEAVALRRSISNAQTPRVSSDRITLRTTIIDEKTRMRERRRRSEDRRLLPSISPSSTGRLSQGRKAMNIMSSSKKATAGRYSALSKGATGRTSFSASLIGAPNLSDFDKKPLRNATPRTPPAKAPAPVRRVLNWNNSPDTDPTPANSNSIATQKSGQKRERETASSAEVLAKRQKYISEQLKSHKRLSQTAPSNRMLRSSLQTLPKSSTSSISNNASGIVNDGNTCYLSATVQALMCDQDLMDRLRRRTQSCPKSAPFSAALKEMCDDRDSSKTLRAGLIRQAVSKHFSQFSSSDQQDAHEFFLRCLDVLAREFASGKLQESPTHASYSLVQEQQFTCTSCGHQTKPRHEILRGLSLDIPELTETSGEVIEISERSIQDLVNVYFAPQDLHLDCDSCDGKNAKSHTAIVLPPRSLVLHVKRFGLDYDSNTGVASITKISDRVNIPESISLCSVLARTASSFQDAVSARTCADLVDKNSLSDVTTSSVHKIGGHFSPPSIAPIDSPVPSSKTQCLSQVSQVQPPPESDPSKRPRTHHEPFNLARRFRVLANPTHGKSNVALSTSLTKSSSHHRNPNASAQDEIQDEICASQASIAIGGQVGLEHHVKAITDLGFSRAEAQQTLREANHDITLAMGLAMDKKRQLRGTVKDLNDDLLDCISEVKQSNVVGNRPSGKYKLAAVIRHHSDTTDNGHYVADALQSDGSWLCYDDASVFKMSHTEPQSREGYLCWYIAE